MRKGKVTDQHIRDAKKEIEEHLIQENYKDFPKDPLEIELQRIFKKDVVTSRRLAYYFGENTEDDPNFSYRLSPKVSKWVSQFNNFEEVEPFEFEIGKYDIVMIEEKLPPMGLFGWWEEESYEKDK